MPRARHAASSPSPRSSSERPRAAGAQPRRGARPARPLNAYITATPEHALRMAEAADERFARAEALPLDGIPIAVKDIFCTKGVLTTAGSHILDGYHPPYES